MAYSKQIICLANSKKIHGRCVAGKTAAGEGKGDWLRPVSERVTREVSEDERMYADGTDPKLLDIIEIRFRDHVPTRHQQENHLIDVTDHWRKIGESTFADVKGMLDQPASLWGNGDHSYSGINNRILGELATGVSLYLVDVGQVKLIVEPKAAAFGNMKKVVRAEFEYRDVTYRLDCTDPVICREYISQGYGEYSLDDVILCVSLGEPYDDGRCYKLVAAVLHEDRFDD